LSSSNQKKERYAFMPTLEIMPQRGEAINLVGVAALNRLQVCSDDLCRKAMELTDSWGQAMFILCPATVQKIFSALGFRNEVCTRVYDAVRALSYVDHRQEGKPNQSEMTWHIVDAACMTLRGVVGLGSAMASINDETVEDFLQNNAELFQQLMKAMPDYTAYLMFSPEVAATVVASLGGNLSADKIYELAFTHGGQVTKDLEGRRGVSTQFIRSLTLTISARI